jgi:hypothetical protein
LIFLCFFQFFFFLHCTDFFLDPETPLAALQPEDVGIPPQKHQLVGKVLRIYSTKSDWVEATKEVHDLLVEWTVQLSSCAGLIQKVYVNIPFSSLLECGGELVGLAGTHKRKRRKRRKTAYICFLFNQKKPSGERRPFANWKGAHHHGSGQFSRPRFAWHSFQLLSKHAQEIFLYSICSP